MSSSWSNLVQSTQTSAHTHASSASPPGAHNSQSSQVNNMFVPRSIPYVEQKSANDALASQMLDSALLEYYQTAPPSLPRSVLQPRGFDNRNNSCFSNSVLQSLLSCREFGHLLRFLLDKSSAFSLPPAMAAMATTFGEHKELTQQQEAHGGSLNTPQPQQSHHRRKASVASSVASVASFKSNHSAKSTQSSNGAAANSSEASSQNPQKSSKSSAAKRRARKKKRRALISQQPQSQPATSSKEPPSENSRTSSTKQQNGNPLPKKPHQTSANGNSPTRTHPNTPPNRNQRQTSAPRQNGVSSQQMSDLRWANWRGIPYYPAAIEPEARAFTARDTFGAQQDAHEFLQYLVDKMHTELKLNAHVLKDVKKSEKSDDSVENSVSDEWQEVGKRNRAQLVRANVEFDRSPLSDLFGGRMRIALKSRGAQDSVSYQPFFTFPLEIADSRVHTIEQAFRASIDREQVQGYRGKANYEVSASKTTTLDVLPQIFVFNLKRFQFNDYGVASKITRQIRFSENFTVPQKNVFGIPNSERSTSYSLQAVIVHHGHSANGGHYVACVKHDQLGWLLCDDRSIQKVELRYVLSRQAYVLLYRRKSLDA